jgi:hypothetical protein
MLSDVILYPSYADTYARILDDGKELFITHDLTHYASMLIENCVSDEIALGRAVQKAMTVCITAGITPTEHFRTIFIYSDHMLIRDWLVSDLGLQLIILNADVTNPVVARLQLELLSKHEMKNTE